MSGYPPSKPPKNPPPGAKSDFDSDFGETGAVPSVTNLLKRKSLKKKGPEKDKEKDSFSDFGENEVLPGTSFLDVKPLPPEPVDPDALFGSPKARSAGKMGATSIMRIEKAALDEPKPEEPEKVQSHVQKAKRRTKVEGPDLLPWTWGQLQTSKDILASTLVELKKQSVTSALFLAMRVEDKSPYFLATAELNGKERTALWKGIRWEPKVAPELWNVFIRSGFVEASPPGVDTQIGSARNLLRNAFGIFNSDTLTLIRVGSAQKCRGVLAVISEKSLTEVVNHALTKLSK